MAEVDPSTVNAEDEVRDEHAPPLAKELCKVNVKEAIGDEEDDEEELE